MKFLFPFVAILSTLFACGPDLKDKNVDQAPSKAQVINAPSSTPADVVAYRSTVAIHVDWKFKCAGALIADNIVVTEKRCVEKANKQQIVVGFGRSLDALVMQPVVGVEIQTTSTQRLALLRVAMTPFGFGPTPVIPYVAPQERRYDRKTSPTSTGWGHLIEIAGFGETRDGAQDSGTLRVAISKFVRVGPEEDLMILGERPNFQGPCRGDDASPAYDLKLKKWYVHGIKFGPISKCEPDTHVYIELGTQAHTQWIAQATKRLNALKH